MGRQHKTVRYGSTGRRNSENGGLEIDRTFEYGAVVPRILGARLAVPLVAIPVLVIAAAAPAVGGTAAADGCRPTPDGISCSFGGSIGSSSARPVPGNQPPLRYLATTGGACWYWSRHRPGLDSWDSANDQAIILTRLHLPRCRRRTAPAVVIDASARAWRIFRSFPLDAPSFRLSPDVGITNLPARLHLEPPGALAHRETLPDGRRLEVAAQVTAVWIDWSDGSPPTGVPAASAIGDPGTVRHSYALKTCPAEYRSEHLDGPKCHPELERYPVVVTFEWTGRYRTGGTWLLLGTIDRTGILPYDVDEVLGVLIAP